MSDKFGRHKSTRWVKATVPTYGDDWDDEYGSGEESGEEQVHQKEVIPQRFELPVEAKIAEEPDEQSGSEHSIELHNSGNPDQKYVESEDDGEFNVDDLHDTFKVSAANSKVQPDLVLSIDRLRNRDYDSSSDEEKNDEYATDGLVEPIPAEEQHVAEPANEIEPAVIKSAAPVRRSVTFKNPQEIEIVTPSKSNSTAQRKKPLSSPFGLEPAADYVPPTPTFNEKFLSEPDTPMSDKSYLSDQDSIQNEPVDLNLAGYSKGFNVKPSIEAENRYQQQTPIENGEHFEAQEHYLQAPETETITSRSHSQKSQVDRSSPPLSPRGSPESAAFVETSPVSNYTTPLVLSIDHRNLSDEEEDDSADSNDDDWGFNSQSSSIKNETGLELHHAAKVLDSNENEERSESESTEREDLDQQKVKDTKHRVETDALDSLINDLHHASLGTDDESEAESQSNQSEMAPGYELPSLDEVSSLPDFANDYNDYEKNLDLNTSLDLEDTTPIAPLSTAQTQTRHENFIQGHRHSIRKPPPKRSALVSGDYSNIADAMSGYSSEKSLRNQSTESVKLASDDKELEESPETFVSEDVLKRPDLELKPVISSGSVSTGRASFDTTSISSKNDIMMYKPPASDDVGRRVSTMSTSTFNMGAWKPNTGNYRDQFINDNDNESALNLNMSSHSDDYEKFTKLRTSSGLGNEVMSNASSVSVPDTIDVALPRISEDPDYGDDYEDEKHDTLSKTTSKLDSVLGDHNYSSPLFKEEKLTPAASKDHLPSLKENTNRRYSSLLGPVSSDPTDKEVSRVVSGDPSVTDSEATVKHSVRTGSVSTAGTEQTLLHSAKKFKSQPYPTSDWKKIMATSQPVDRIRLLKEALEAEATYDSGLQGWLNDTLKSSENGSNIHIGRIASAAYQNAQHNDIRRHNSLRSKVSIVKDKVDITGLSSASSFFGKRLLNRGKKLMKSGE